MSRIQTGAVNALADDRGEIDVEALIAQNAAAWAAGRPSRRDALRAYFHECRDLYEGNWPWQQAALTVENVTARRGLFEDFLLLAETLDPPWASHLVGRLNMLRMLSDPILIPTSEQLQRIMHLLADCELGLVSPGPWVDACFTAGSLRTLLWLCVMGDQGGHDLTIAGHRGFRPPYKVEVRRVLPHRQDPQRSLDHASDCPAALSIARSETCRPLIRGLCMCGRIYSGSYRMTLADRSLPTALGTTPAETRRRFLEMVNLTAYEYRTARANERATAAGVAMEDQVYDAQRRRMADRMEELRIRPPARSADRSPSEPTTLSGSIAEFFENLPNMIENARSHMVVVDSISEPPKLEDRSRRLDID